MTIWDAARTVSVTAAADDDDLADTAKLSHDASGGGYDEVPDAPLWAAVAGGGARIASAGPRTGSVYVVNGQRVTVTEETGVLPGVVEIDLPSDLDKPVSVTFAPVAGDVPRESGSFRLEHDGARAMVDVSVMPMLDKGVELCLMPPAGMREGGGPGVRPGDEAAALHGRLLDGGDEFGFGRLGRVAVAGVRDGEEDLVVRGGVRGHGAGVRRHRADADVHGG